MLKKIHIENFLSCEDVTIDFSDDITALVGRNAAGKTNILKAINKVAGFFSGRDDFISELVNSNKELSLELTIDIQGAQYLYQLGLKKKNDDELSIQKFPPFKIIETLHDASDNSKLIIFTRIGKNLSIKKEFISEKTISYATDNPANEFFYLSKSTGQVTLDIPEHSPVFHLIKSLISNSPITEIANKIRDILNKVYYYELIESDKIESSFVHNKGYNEWLEDYRKEKIPDTSNVMRLIHLYKDDTETFGEIGNLLGVMTLGLISSIDISEVMIHKDKEDLFYVLRFTMPNGAEVSYGDLSFGTQRIISILLALLHDDSSILLLEQPEDGIHVGLLRRFIPLCQRYADEYNKQLMITTHSYEMVDMLQPESIRLVSMSESGTKASSLSKEDICHLKTFVEDEGTLSEYLEILDNED